MTGRRSRSARSTARGARSPAARRAPRRAPARRARHPLEAPPPSRDLVGRLAFREARAEDTFVDLAPALGVGYVELVAANPGVDPWLPQAGTRLVVPKARLLPSGPREGIVVNLGDLRLYYFEPGQPPRSVADRHRQGRLRDAARRHEGDGQAREADLGARGESARRDGLAREVKPGPDNPLGEYALYLGWPSLSDPRHQRPARRRPSFEPRLHPALSGRHRGALRARRAGYDACAS